MARINFIHTSVENRVDEGKRLYEADSAFEAGQKVCR